MGHTTTYTRPSIADEIKSLTTIEGVAAWREALEVAHAAGKIDADIKTVRRWNELIWAKVFALITHAPTARDACYVYGVQMRWEKPEYVALALELLLSEVCAKLPDEVELAARRGVVIEGVSTPAQIATAARVRFGREIKRVVAENNAPVVRINLTEDAA